MAYKQFFYQKAWDLVGPGVTLFVKCIFVGEEKLGDSSEAMLVLIPKFDNPSMIT